MATGPRYSVPYKRKRENKTNYGKRLSAVKSKNPRLVVRKTNKRMIAQIIRFEESGDKTIISASNNDLILYFGGNTAAETKLAAEVIKYPNEYDLDGTEAKVTGKIGDVEVEIIE